MQKIWRPRAASIENNFSVNSDLLRQLLVLRGLTAAAEIDHFLTPDYERDLHDPFLMLDMERAGERILRAVSAGEKIAIFADYDADGVPGAAILVAFFRQIGFSNFTVYIPDRHEESYGLNNQALETLAASGAKLIITVDCGITDVTAVEEANRLEMDVIITDHHLVPEVLPPAYAIINPKRLNDQYPYKMLSGAGVAFKLVQALLRSVLKDAPRTDFVIGWEKWLLDLVAIATVSDMVPLTGENRALVYFGLKVLRRTPRLGLRRLFARLNLTAEFITEDDISFLIGPRLNSASRMSHGHEAYALLTAADEVEADRLARHLEEKNNERRASVAAILETVRSDSAAVLGAVFVAGSPSWSLGVLGLAASRLAEQYRRPIFLWSRNGRGEIKGSCRSDGTVNIVELMKLAQGAAGDLFINYGGHAAAGGFSLAPERLSELAPRLAEAYSSLEKLIVSGDQLFDLELPLTVISDTTYSLLEQLAPFGPENHKPIFFFSRLPLLSRRTFGRGASHLEMIFEHPDLGQIKAVQFFTSPKGEAFRRGGRPRLDILATLEKSYYRGRSELRLRIVDWRESV
ncbi:MAG: single-stranded-DNA-specific exonuclease RecJ [Candidatus Vogelbacteria bacterium]|nr:single-stranded-DNA-specific exonuclease RecJ [Candidatus Vogelbacteria bacterium]